MHSDTPVLVQDRSAEQYSGLHPSSRFIPIEFDPIVAGKNRSIEQSWVVRPHGLPHALPVS